MSWSPKWEPSGLPSTRHSSIFDLSHPRNGYCTDARFVELNKPSVRMDHCVRQLPGTTFLPPIYGAIGLRRSPLSSFAGLPTMLPSVVGSRFPLPSSKSSHPDHTSLTRPTFFSPLEDSSYCGSPVVTGPLVHQAHQPFKPSSFSPPVSPHPSLHLHSTYLSSFPKRSKAALAVEDWDHPSFARPPHRAFESQSMDEIDYRRPVVNEPGTHHAQTTPSALNVDQDRDANDEPLVPNLYPVPPPPPYEQSAAPLSDLAADMVWERCYFSKTRPAVSPVSMAHRPWDSTLSWSPSPGYPHQLEMVDCSSHWSASSNTYGVIGAEAKARRSNRQYSSSGSSPHSNSSNGSNHCRKLSTGTKMEVKPAFRRWTRQVLEQTLLSPQVLILALYYIDCVASADVFGDGNNKLSLLPYKMLLSALVVANKTLDDHSYRNSTFANVSSMTNAEVNAIEVALLSSLNFNVVPTSEQWTNWLKDVIDAGERLGFHDPHLGLHSPLSRLVVSQHLNQPQDIRSPSHLAARSIRQGSIFDQAPTPDYVWHPHSESLAPVVDHKQFSSGAPSHLTGFDFRMQHTPATLHFGGDYVGPNACVNIVPHHGHYSKSHYQQYS